MYSYSKRLSWSFSSNFLSRLLAEKRKSGARLFDLTVSNPTEALDDYPFPEIARAYADLKDFRYQPNPFGNQGSRLEVARYYQRRGIVASPDRILLTASTSEAYSVLFKLLCDPGDEILVPFPSYPLFEYLASLETVRIVPYRLQYDGSWFIDFASLRQAISSHTRSILIVNPNNPTGSFLKKTEIEVLLEIAERSALPVISDEVFMDYSFAADTTVVKTLIGFDSVLSFSLNGLSKAAGMPQMKLAWIVVNGPEGQRNIARERLELILDTYLSLGTPVQSALPALLTIGESVQQQICLRTRQNLKALDAVLSGCPARRLYYEGGWSAIIQLPRTLSEEDWLTRLLQEQNVIAQPGYFFDMASEAYVVVSLITPEHDFLEGIQRLRQLASSV